MKLLLSGGELAAPATGTGDGRASPGGGRPQSAAIAGGAGNNGLRNGKRFVVQHNPDAYQQLAKTLVTGRPMTAPEGGSAASGGSRPTTGISNAVTAPSEPQCSRPNTVGGDGVARLRSPRSRAGACTINRPCAQQYVGKYQSCMVASGRLIRHARPN